MAEENTSVPSTQEGQTQPTEQTSAGTDAGNDEKKTSEALSQIPDNLKGKGETELVQMYQSLEKKLGEQSGEVKEARETKKNIEILLGAIGSDPNRYKTAQEWINTYLYGGTTNTSGEGAKEAETSTQQPKAADDTRRVLQQNILSNFYTKYGIDKLPTEEQAQAKKQLGNSFAELLDPGGTKSVTQVLNELPIDRLGGYLESAYIVANREKILQAAKTQGMVSSELNRQASIGSLTSATGSSGSSFELTAEEREVAQKLGIKPEDYAKNKSR